MYVYVLNSKIFQDILGQLDSNQIKANMTSCVFGPTAFSAATNFNSCTATKGPLDKWCLIRAILVLLLVMMDLTWATCSESCWGATVKQRPDLKPVPKPVHMGHGGIIWIVGRHLLAIFFVQNNLSDWIISIWFYRILPSFQNDSERGGSRNLRCWNCEWFVIICHL